MAKHDSNGGWRSHWVQMVAAIGIVVVIALGGRAIAHSLAAFGMYVRTIGPAGPILFVLGFAVASAVFVPAGLLTLTSGAVFGLVHGAAYAFLACSLGALLSFSISRYVLRGFVERQLARSPRAQVVISGIGTDGRRICALLRLSPVIPFNLINVAMAVTTIPLRDFLAACVAMIPATLLYTYYGVAAKTLVEAQEEHLRKDALYYTFLVAGLAATIVATTVVARTARRALAKYSLR